MAKKFHRVKDGESFSSIADDFKTAVDALTELNPNIDPLKLTPGARIRVQYGASSGVSSSSAISRQSLA